MSFNPEVGYWFSVHAPHVLRGLVATEREKRGAKGDLQRRLALWRSRPHFLAYDIRDLPSRFAARARRPVLTWKVRTADASPPAGGPPAQITPHQPARSYYAAPTR